MERFDIMNNDNNMNFQNINGSNNVYKSAGNLNKAIDNPSLDISNATNVNMLNNDEVLRPQSFMGSDSYINYNNTNVDNSINTNVNNTNFNTNINTNVNSNINNNINSSFNTNFSDVNTNVDLNSNTMNNYSDVNVNDYKPVYSKKKEKNNNKVAISDELRFLIVLSVLIFVFIMFLPNLYDLVSKGISLVFNR